MNQSVHFSDDFKTGAFTMKEECYINILKNQHKLVSIDRIEVLFLFSEFYCNIFCVLI